MIAALVVGGGVAIAAGPVGWALLVMIGVPIVLLVLFGSAGHESPVHPNFAPPQRPQPPRQS
jgi:hypothetical protein